MTGSTQELTREPTPEEDWRITLRKRQHQQFIEDGYIQVDAYGDATLSEKGIRRVAARLEKLAPGDEYLIEMAVLAGHGFTITAN